MHSFFLSNITLIISGLLFCFFSVYTTYAVWRSIFRGANKVLEDRMSLKDLVESFMNRGLRAIFGVLVAHILGTGGSGMVFALSAIAHIISWVNG